MTSGANDIANVLPFAAFRDHEWGHVQCIEHDRVFL